MVSVIALEDRLNKANIRLKILENSQLSPHESYTKACRRELQAQRLIVRNIEKQIAKEKKRADKEQGRR